MQLGPHVAALLWLWCRPPATALFRPLAWEPSYATGVALKRQKKKKKRFSLKKEHYQHFEYCIWKEKGDDKTN